MVCEVAAINATRSGYKYGNEDRRYRGKEKGLFQVGGAVGENIIWDFTVKVVGDRKRALRCRIDENVMIAVFHARKHL